MKVYVTIEINDDDYRDMQELAHLKGQTFNELVTENNNEFCELFLDPRLDFERLVQKKRRAARERAKQSPHVRQ